MAAARTVRQVGDVDLGAYMVLARELESVAARLRSAELSVEGALGPRQLSEAVRFAFDPTARATQAVRNASAQPEQRGLRPGPE